MLYLKKIKIKKMNNNNLKEYAHKDSHSFKNKVAIETNILQPF